MRYDYLYSDDELKPWADWLAEMHHERAVYALFNNHAQAKAVQDARRLRRLMGYCVPNPTPGPSPKGGGEKSQGEVEGGVPTIS